jgi:hypothetical protein
VTRCFDITGAARVVREAVDSVVLDLAGGCDDEDRFVVWTGPAAHLLTPLATELLVHDWADRTDRMAMASACALGRVDAAWLELHVAEFVLAAPGVDVDHLAWWRRLIAARPEATAAIFFGSEVDPTDTGGPPPFGTGSYLSLVAAMSRVACHDDGARAELAGLARRPDLDAPLVAGAGAAAAVRQLFDTPAGSSSGVA